MPDYSQSSRLFRVLDTNPGDGFTQHGPCELRWLMPERLNGGLHYVTAGGYSFGSLRWIGGRQGATGQPESFTVTWTSPAPAEDEPDSELPYGWGVWKPSLRPDIGMQLQIRWTVDLANYTGKSFDGQFDPWPTESACTVYVTDAQLEYAVIGGEAVPSIRWTATGIKSRMGQLVIGDDPWPTDYAYGRAMRIGDAAVAAQSTTLGSSAFEVYPFEGDDTIVIPRDVDAQPAAQLLDDLANETGALCTEQPYGMVEWERLDGRRNRAVKFELPAAVVLSSATWAKQLDGLVNDMSVEYGPEGFRESVRVTDDESIRLHGRYSTGISSQLWYEKDAHRLAALTVGRKSQPRWTISRLDIDCLQIPPALLGELVTLRFGDLITTTGLPATAPTVDRPHMFVEGVEHELTRHDWRLTVYLSDAGQTGAPIRYVDVPPSYSWATTPADMTWLQAAGWFAPPPNSDRWADVAVSVNWYDLNGYYNAPDPAWSWATYDPTPEEE